MKSVNTLAVEVSARARVRVVQSTVRVCVGRLLCLLLCLGSSCWLLLPLGSERGRVRHFGKDVLLLTGELVGQSSCHHRHRRRFISTSCRRPAEATHSRGAFHKLVSFRVF